MVPKIKAKYREKFGVGYTIEQFCGKQFRCHHCGNVFYSDTELLHHLQKYRFFTGKKVKLPEENKSITISLIYTDDFRDELKQRSIK